MKNKTPALAIFLISIVSSGCTTLNDSLTPSSYIQKDGFDNSIRVIQEPVGASSGFSESFHVLGFDWSEKAPNIVFITAGVRGIHNIYDVQFNADGQIINNLIAISNSTDYDGMSKTHSLRRYSMPINNFIKIANSNIVKMKVVGQHGYTLSSFGRNKSGNMVNTKFKPFIGKIRDSIKSKRK